MYQVFFNNYPLHDLREPGLVLMDPSVHLAVGEAGEMRFIIDPAHPYADRLTRLKGILELRAAGVPIFKGRIRKDTQEFLLTREITAEGLLACLNDSIIPPFNFPGDLANDAGYIAAAESGNVVQFFLGWLLEQHNAQVGPDQRILLGDVTVADPNNYISRSSTEYLTTMEAVRKKLEDLLGGYLVADYSGDTTTLHYYADLPLTNVQEVTFGENLLDLVTELDSADTYTAILPIGADGLTLESLADGEVSPGIWKSGRVLYSAEAEDVIGGRITRMVEWDDVTEPANLRRKAAALLTGEGVKTVQTITASAVDLGALNDLPYFRVGRYVRLNSAPHGFAEAYPLMELDPDILDPGNTQITMGATIKTATAISHAQQSAAQEQLNQQRVELGKQQDAIDAMVQTFMEQSTSIIQTTESIVMEALESYRESGEYAEFKQTVEAQLALMSDELSVKFTEVTEQIVDVDGDLQRTVELLTKHFDFSADGLAIRAGENAMSLRLDNDLIIFERNGQQFGWWDGVDFHTGNIVVEVNERAQFGNFAAIPRSNGSLSWLKVRG